MPTRMPSRASSKQLSDEERLTLAATRKVKLEEAAAKSKYLVDPRTSPYLSVWDGVTALALVYTALVTPYEVAFLQPDLVGLFVVNRLVDVVFIIDIVLQFFLAFPLDSDGDGGSRWVTTLPEIRRHYLRGWFALDSVSTLVSVFDIIGFAAANDTVSRLKALRVLRVLRLVKLLRLMRGARIFKRCTRRPPHMYQHPVQDVSESRPFSPRSFLRAACRGDQGGD